MIQRAGRQNGNDAPMESIAPSEAILAQLDATTWRKAFDRFAAKRTNTKGQAVQGAPHYRENTFTKSFSRFGHDYGWDGEG